MTPDADWRALFHGKKDLVDFYGADNLTSSWQEQGDG